MTDPHQPRIFDDVYLWLSRQLDSYTALSNMRRDKGDLEGEARALDKAQAVYMLLLEYETRAKDGEALMESNNGS